MLRCIPSVARSASHSRSQWLICRRYTSVPPNKHSTILTENIYGRTRIYTSLPTMAKGKAATTSNIRLASPVTSQPLSWEWLHNEDDHNAAPSSKSWTRKRSGIGGYGIVGTIKQNLREMFLPVGYPESVHPCYKKFHLWFGLETFVGSTIGVLCSQAMLASLGLGTIEATGGAVAIQWVLKDGIGEFGKLFFIKRYASSFDSHPKTWKFMCEIFSSIGSFLQLCTSIAPPKFFLPLAAVGNTFELIHESVWFASHMTFTKHFAPTGNIGDIVAKDDAQMSTAHLLGMLAGVSLITVSHSPMFLFGAFAILSPINIWSTIKMLNSAEFEILNQAKLTLLSRTFIDTGKVVDYKQLRDREIGFGEWIKPYGPKGGISIRLKLGVSADQAYGSTEEVQHGVKLLKNENYLVNFHKDTMCVLFHEDAGSNDVIKSILHSLKFHDLITSKGIRKEKDWDAYMSAMEDSLVWSKEQFPTFAAELDMKEWQSDAVYWNDSGVRLTWEGRETEDNSI
ncbi:hypothetical protein EC973_008712 [Apophysomyces ossiformis]|uniref:Vitamin B6 photo-protection and homoeostasis-domain-containing protein n=1 Tax=Apophysomyces ossiformis TaxID=679940 RepID=A0A8H7BS45_9FUNG|nr:hypothetical protein EC973_008712 [Apophysomyces ossiformis]